VDVSARLYLICWENLQGRQEGGLDAEELLEGLKNLDFGAEFLALVIEHVDGHRQQKLHLHRMNKAGLNWHWVLLGKC
jgi:hypothetical protein